MASTMERSQVGLNAPATSNPAAFNVDGMATNSNDAPNEAAKPAKKPLLFYLTFVGIQIIVFVYSLDATIMAVALPAITQQLSGSTLQSFWASIVYLLAVAVTQPLYSTISDSFGRKYPLFVAFVLFVIGSIIFATSQNMVAVIVGRVLQGLGGGGINVLGEIIVTDMTTLRERPLYLGVMAIPTAAGSVLGPIVGGLFSNFVTWRWIGWVNLPLLGVAFPLIFLCLRLRALEISMSERFKSLDWIGMALFAAGCSIFVMTLSWADSLYPWTSWRTLFPFTLGAVLLAAFAFYEGRPFAAAVPVMPHHIFRSRTASLTLFGGFIHGFILFPLLLYMPLFYQAISLESQIESAVTLLPASVTSVFAAVASAVIIGIVGKGFRWALWIAWALTAIGSGVLILLDQSSDSNMRRGLPIIWAAGVGGLLRINQLPIQASLKSVDDTAIAVSLLLSFRVFGGIVGLAVGSAIFNSVFTHHIPAMQNIPAAAGLNLPRSTEEAIGFIPAIRTLPLSTEELGTIQEAYLAALRTIFYVMTAIGGSGFLSSLFIEELSFQKDDRGRQQFEHGEAHK
ncbi:Major facilitator superfamily transporter [Paramyrothecium foliicola]|nr:Major facilitator superfamily transporter [Paramyrothecium foliicola]